MYIVIFVNVIVYFKWLFKQMSFKLLERASKIFVDIRGLKEGWKPASNKVS